LTVSKGEGSGHVATVAGLRNIRQVENWAIKLL